MHAIFAHGNMLIIYIHIYLSMVYICHIVVMSSLSNPYRKRVYTPHIQSTHTHGSGINISDSLCEPDNLIADLEAIHAHNSSRWHHYDMIYCLQCGRQVAICISSPLAWFQKFLAV